MHTFYLYGALLTMVAQLCIAAHPGEAGVNFYCNSQYDGRKRRAAQCTAEAGGLCVQQYCEDQCNGNTVVLYDLPTQGEPLQCDCYCAP
ncbi:hypothetical protein BST61_g1287 [Cercospora zeina]